MSVNGAVDLEVARQLLIDASQRSLTPSEKIQVANAWIYLGWAKCAMEPLDRATVELVQETAKPILAKIFKETPNA